MINFDTDPGTGVLFIGLLLFIALGFLTLTGTWALVIWVAIGLVVAFAIYFVGVRFAKWARGEYSVRSRGGEH